MSVEMPARAQLGSLDIAADRIALLREDFPEVFCEDAIDFDALKRSLGEWVEPGRERFGLSWPGKANAMRAVQQRSHATLVPDRAESVDFDTTGNVIIEGENLETLKLLQRSYYGQVKMIYIDPPYNTGNDFIYPDDYSQPLQEYLKYSGQVDGNGARHSTNAESSGRYHSNWLNMMYPRLFLARNLLRDDGVIFVSIDDHEVHNLRVLMNEIYGEENFIAQFIWNTEGHTDNQLEVKVNHEYITLYAKNVNCTTLGHVVDPNTRQDSNLWRGIAENSITKNGRGNPPSEVALPVGFPCQADSLDLAPSLVSQRFFDECKEAGYISRNLTKTHAATYPVRLDPMIARQGVLVAPCRVFSGWANVNKLRAFIANNCRPLEDDEDQLTFHLSANGVIYYQRSRDKARNILSVLKNMGTTERMRSELESMGIHFQYPKPKELISHLVQIGLAEGIVLDFFAGSGTTGHAVMKLNAEDGGNRRFILVQLPEPADGDYPTISAITRERVRRAGRKIKTEQTGTLNLTNSSGGGRILAFGPIASRAAISNRGTANRRRDRSRGRLRPSPTMSCPAAPMRTC